MIQPEAPVRTGYHFAGWQKDGGAYTFSTPVTGSFTLTAAWTLDAPEVSVTAAYAGGRDDFTYNKGDLVFTARPTHSAGGIRYTYQWLDAAGTPVEGATGQSFTLPAANAGEYQYSCEVTAIDSDGRTAAATETARATIQKQTVPAPAADETAFVYSGREQTYAIDPDARYTVSGNTRRDAGSYTVTVSLGDKANYQWADGSNADRTYPFVIAKAAVDFAVTENSHDYDALEKAAVVTPRSEVSGLTVADGDYALRYELNGQTVTPVRVGSYAVIVALQNDNLTFAGESDGVREKQVGTLEIKGVPYPAGGTMTWPVAGELTYGQTLGESALTGGDQTASGRYAWKDESVMPTVNNGGYTVVFTPNDPNYAPVEQIVAVQVAPRELTLAGVTAASRDYEPGNTAVALSGGSLEGIVNRDGAPDEVAPDAAKAQGRLAAPDAGENLAVTVGGYALTGADAANYTLRQPDYVTVTITPAQGEATLTMDSWTYGQTPARPAADSATNGTEAVTYRYTGVLADGVTPYDSADPPANAGRYQVQAVFAATNNYRAVTVRAEFAIGRSLVPVPAADETAFVYNGREQTYAIRPDARYIVSGSTRRDAGSYTVTVSLDDKANCQWADGGTDDRTYPFTIAKREISATWDLQDMVYNGAAQAPRIVGLIGVQQTDAGKVEALAAQSAQIQAGSYSARARLTGEQAHNYILRNDTASFVIRPATVTFRVENNSVRYDGQPHTAQVTAQALGQDFDDFTVRYQTMDGMETAQPVEAGRYQILAEIADPNYRHSGGADHAARQIGGLEIYDYAAPAEYSLTFLPGAEDAAGSPPSLPAGLAGSVYILPDQAGLERAGHRFAGWQYKGRVYAAGSAFVMPAEDVNFTAVWTEAAYAIGGSVVWETTGPENDPQPVGDVLITLMRGNEQIAQTLTGPDGGFSFQQVSAGLYNLVAAYGGIVQTQKVELIDRDQNQCRIQLPEGNTNSVLKVLDGAPPVVVGNLDNVFTPQPDEVYTEEDRRLVKSGGTVEIRMTVAREDPAPDSPMGNALEKLSGGFAEGLTIDLTLNKTRTDADGASVDERPVTESNLLIEVVIPLNGAMQNCRGYRVLRQHEGTVDEIGTEANAQGEYFVVNESRTVLTIFARQFSLYSVLYANALPAAGGQTAPTLPEEQTPAMPPAVLEAADPDTNKKDPAEEPASTPAATFETEAPLSGPEPPRQEESEADQPQPLAEQRGGKPFVLLNAAASLLGLLMAFFATSRGRARGASAVCAVCALAVTLLTGGWSGLALADIWTLPIALLVVLAFRFSRQTRGPQSSGGE